ncbi:hypothetical protein MP228_008751 [Amoeboaphelidium protococcarum]|nr:hypothetical protein MP228_008751 [Amoeboaphelidium protococcarum]
MSHLPQPLNGQFTNGRRPPGGGYAKFDYLDRTQDGNSNNNNDGDNGDSSRKKSAQQRRTVDYNCLIARWIQDRSVLSNVHGGHRGYFRQPHSHYIINFHHPHAEGARSAQTRAEYMNTKYIHTSINKIRTPINVVRWTLDGRRIVSGCVSGEITLWNGSQFNFESIIQGHDAAIRSMEWVRTNSSISTDFDMFIACDQTGIIKYWQSNLNCVKSITGIVNEPIRGLSVAPSDLKFCIGSDDSTVRIFDLFTAQEEKVWIKHGWDVKVVNWHPRKALIASGSKDNMIKLWDPRQDDELTTIHGHKNTVLGLEFCPHDDNLLLAGSRDGMIRVYDLRTMKPLHSIDFNKVYNGFDTSESAVGDSYKLAPHSTLTQNREITAVRWHNAIPGIFTVGTSLGSIHHFDLNIGQFPNTNENGFYSNGQMGSIEIAHESCVWSLDYHPLGHILASGGNDCYVRFWSRAKLGTVYGVGDGYVGDEEVLTVGMFGGKGQYQGFDQQNQAGKKAQANQRYQGPNSVQQPYRSQNYGQSYQRPQGGHQQQQNQNQRGYQFSQQSQNRFNNNPQQKFQQQRRQY